jgi:hypothetical protein
MSPRRNLKKLQDGKRRTEQSGINLKIPNSSLPKCPVNTFVPVDQQEEKSIDSMRKALKKKIKRYQENPQLYRTRQEINEHIFDKRNGVTITLI